MDNVSYILPSLLRTMSSALHDIIVKHLLEWSRSAAEVTRLTTIAVALYTLVAYWIQPYHTSKLTGYDWVMELVNSHLDRIYTELGVQLHIFICLVIKLCSMRYSDSQNGLTLEEQLTIFLYTCVRGLSVCHVGERFQHSNATIAKFAHCVFFDSIQY